MKVHPSFPSCFGMVLLCIAANLHTAVAAFALPGEGPASFRRDRLPIEAEMQQEIANNLVVIARGLPMDTAPQRRAKAQALALAVALDPVQAEARQILKALAENGSVSSQLPAQDVMKDAVSRIWAIIAGLKSSPQSEAFVSCLSDIMAVTVPQDTRSVDWLAVEPAADVWKNWVPDLSAYEDESKPEGVAEAAQPSEPPPVAEDHPKPRQSGFKLGKASIPTLAFQRSNNLYLPVSLQMETEAGSEFTLKSAYGVWPQKLLQILRQRHPDAPRGVLSFSLIPVAAGQQPAMMINRGQASAAMLVLGDAAITGNEPGAMIIGQISDRGVYELPGNFWTCLIDLSKSNQGGRLILPTAAAEYLPALLVLEKADFFLKYEVCLAANTDELISRAAKKQPEEISAIHRRFEVLMGRGDQIAAARLLADPSIRQQLEEIGRQLPYHASARVLAMQAAGNRPVYLPRKAAAASIQLALSSMDWIGNATYAPDASDLPRMEKSYDSAREALAGVGKLIDGDDKEMIRDGDEIINKLRILIRIYKSSNIYDYRISEISKSFEELRKAYKESQQKIQAIKNSR